MTSHHAGGNEVQQYTWGQGDSKLTALALLLIVNGQTTSSAESLTSATSLHRLLGWGEDGSYCGHD